MSVGSILVGVGVLLVVAAYLARPFRAQGAASVERTIEAWVAEARAARPSPAAEEGEAALFCSQCGRRAAPDDRFCARCGARLRREEE